MTNESDDEKPDENMTTQQQIVHIMAADSTAFPIRKVGSFLMLATGLGLIVYHSVMHEGEGPNKEAWLLMTIGGVDLGIRTLGTVLKKLLTK